MNIACIREKQHSPAVKERIWRHGDQRWCLKAPQSPVERIHISNHLQILFGSTAASATAKASPEARLACASRSKSRRKLADNCSTYKNFYELSGGYYSSVSPGCLVYFSRASWENTKRNYKAKSLETSLVEHDFCHCGLKSWLSAALFGRCVVKCWKLPKAVFTLYLLAKGSGSVSENCSDWQDVQNSTSPRPRTWLPFDYIQFNQPCVQLRANLQQTVHWIRWNFEKKILSLWPREAVRVAASVATSKHPNMQQSKYVFWHINNDSCI